MPVGAFAMYLGIVRKYLSAKDGGVIQREGSVMVDCNICGEGERLSCLHSDSGRIRAVLSSLITSLKRLVDKNNGRHCDRPQIGRR